MSGGATACPATGVEFIALDSIFITPLLVSGRAAGSSPQRTDRRRWAYAPRPVRRVAPDRRRQTTSPAGRKSYARESASVHARRQLDRAGPAIRNSALP